MSDVTLGPWTAAVISGVFFVAGCGLTPGAQLVVLRQAVEGLRDLALASHAQRIAALGIVDRDVGDMACIATVVDTGKQQVVHLISGRCILRACSWVRAGVTSL